MTDVTSPSTAYLVNHRDTKDIKLRARKLFSKVFNFSYIVGVNIIKAKYPKFNSKLMIHWCNLLDTLEKEMQIQEKPPMTLKEALDDYASRKLRDKGIYITKTDTFMGRCIHYAFRGVTLGRIGYSNSSEKYYVAFGKSGMPTYVKDVETAIATFLNNTSATWNNAKMFVH